MHPSLPACVDTRQKISTIFRDVSVNTCPLRYGCIALATCVALSRRDIDEFGFSLLGSYIRIYTYIHAHIYRSNHSNAACAAITTTCRFLLWEQRPLVRHEGLSKTKGKKYKRVCIYVSIDTHSYVYIYICADNLLELGVGIFCTLRPCRPEPPQGFPTVGPSSQPATWSNG